MAELVDIYLEHFMCNREVTSSRPHQNHSRHAISLPTYSFSTGQFQEWTQALGLLLFKIKIM